MTSTQMMALMIQHHEKKYPIVFESEDRFKLFRAALRLLDPEFEVTSYNLLDGKVAVYQKVKPDEWVELSEPETEKQEPEKKAPEEPKKGPEPEKTAPEAQAPEEPKKEKEPEPEMSLELLVHLINQRLVALNKGDEIYTPPTAQSRSITDRKQALLGAVGPVTTEYVTSPPGLFTWTHLSHTGTIHNLEFLPTTIPNHSKEQTLALYSKLLPSELMTKIGLQPFEFTNLKAGDHVYSQKDGTLSKLLVKKVEGNTVHLFSYHFVNISKKPLNEMEILPICLPGQTAGTTLKIYQEMFPSKNLQTPSTAFELGEILVVVDTTNKKCGVEIFGIRGNQIGIHYLQWGEKYDEWIPIDSTRIIREHRFNAKQIILGPDIILTDAHKNIGLLLKSFPQCIDRLAKQGVMITLCLPHANFAGPYLFRLECNGLSYIINSCHPMLDDIRGLVHQLL